MRTWWQLPWFPYFYEVSWKFFLFVGTNFRGFYKMHWSMWSWIRGFKHCRQQSMGKLHFVGFLLSWFKWTTKSTNIKIPTINNDFTVVRSILLYRYSPCHARTFWQKNLNSDGQQFYQYQQNEQSPLTSTRWEQEKDHKLAIPSHPVNKYIVLSYIDQQYVTNNNRILTSE